MLGFNRWKIRRRGASEPKSRKYRWRPHLEGLEDRCLLAGATPVSSPSVPGGTPPTALVTTNAVFPTGVNPTATPGELPHSTTGNLPNTLPVPGTGPGSGPASSSGGALVNNLPFGEGLNLLGFSGSLAGALSPESLIGSPLVDAAFANDISLPGEVVGLNNALPGADPRGGLNEGVLIGGGLMAGGFFYTGANNGGFNNATFIGGFNPASLNGGAFIGGPAYRGTLIGGLSLVGFSSAGYDAGGY
jgi:hypothetical protein